MKDNNFKLLFEGVNLSENCIYYTGEIETDFLNLIRFRIELLRSLNKEESCTLYLNSDGGDPLTVLATIDYFNSLLLKNNYTINIVAEGRCYSAALLLLLGTTGKRETRENTLFMFHFLENLTANDRAGNIVKEKIEKIIKNCRFVSEKFNIFREKYFFDALEASQNNIATII